VFAGVCWGDELEVAEMDGIRGKEGKGEKQGEEREEEAGSKEKRHTHFFGNKSWFTTMLCVSIS
jgi:hypothetical protein